MSRQKRRRDSGSTPPVGSSRNTIGGSWRIAQPSASRCRQPPDSVARRASSRGRAGRPSRARTRGARARRSPVEAVDAAEERGCSRSTVSALVEREALRHVADAPLDAFGIAADVDAADRARCPTSAAAARTACGSSWTCRRRCCRGSRRSRRRATSNDTSLTATKSPNRRVRCAHLDGVHRSCHRPMTRSSRASARRTDA